MIMTSCVPVWNLIRRLVCILVAQRADLGRLSSSSDAFVALAATATSHHGCLLRHLTTHPSRNISWRLVNIFLASYVRLKDFLAAASG